MTEQDYEARYEPTEQEEAALARLEGKARAIREQLDAKLRADGAVTALREAADFYDQVLKDMGADVSCDPRYWTAVRDVAMGLRRRAEEAQR